MRSLWLGRVDYGDALQLQRELAAFRRDGALEDVLLLLEHPPTITLGRGADPANLLITPQAAAEQRISIVEVDRGGDVTYHGPGQLVGYPILDLARHRKDVHWYLREIEAAVIDLLSCHGIDGRRFPPHTGVWVVERKIAAIGVKVSRWVTTHGFALNVTNTSREFACIIPCGIKEYGVTSVLEEIGRSVQLAGVARQAARVFSARFEAASASSSLDGLPFSGASKKILATALDMASDRC